jgi:lipid A 3-O-deacylase
MGKWSNWCGTLIVGIGLVGARIQAADATAGGAQDQPPQHLAANSHLTLDAPAEKLWAGDVGDGFQKGAHELALSAGAGFGIAALGGSQTHDMALATVDYGRMLTGVVGGDSWYRGNFELLGEAFGGYQFHPRHGWLVAAAPLLRYNFATGTRWVPFFNVGAGIGATDIGRPDLSTTFEFNVQGGVGVRYFLRRDVALEFQYRFLHVSNSSIRSPNLGVNVNMFYAGVGWFF